MFIVTGASSGIGRATAAALAQRGVDVLAVARRAEQLAELQRMQGSKIRALPADLATDQGIEDLITVASTHERVEGVIHAAGSLIAPREYGELRADDLAEAFRVHVVTPIEINNRLGDLLRGGRLVYIDSYSATAPRLGWCGYSIVKSAAQMAARSASEEFQEAQVIRVFPGGVRTELVQTILDSPRSSPTRDVFSDMAKSGALAEPEVIGGYIARIALDASLEQLADREFWDFNDATSHL